MRPPTQKKTMSFPPCSVWPGNSMTHTKIIAVRASLVQFWFQKQIEIRVTIPVKMKRESFKFNENFSNMSQLWLRTLQEN